MVDRSSPNAAPPGGPQRPPLSAASLIFRLGAIAVVVAAVAGAFAYVHGTFDPQRLTPKALVDVLEKNNGVHPGFAVITQRRADRAFREQWRGASVFHRAVFNAPRTPVVGRFALPAGNLMHRTAACRSAACAAIHSGQCQQWRTGEQHAGVPGWHAWALSVAAGAVAGSGHRQTGSDQGAAFFAAHRKPCVLTWVKTAKPSASYATETYNSVNAFYLVDASGKKQAVRWSMKPLAQDAAGATAPEGGDFLEKDLVRRLASAPLRFQLNITLANADDPVNDASKTWPEGRKVLNAGTLVLEQTNRTDGESVTSTTTLVMTAA